MSGHPETTGVVDDDQVDSSFFEKLGADPSPCTSRNDALASIERSPQPRVDFGSRVRVSFSSPRIRHVLIALSALFVIIDGLSDITKQMYIFYQVSPA